MVLMMMHTLYFNMCSNDNFHTNCSKQCWKHFKKEAHIKGYLNLEFTMKHPGMDPPQINLVVTDPPQQTDGSSCGLFLLQYTETLFNRCCNFLISKQNLFLKLYPSPLRLDIICSDTSPLYDPLAIRQDWFSPTSPVNMRHQLAMTIQNLAAEQGLCINWPDLDLN